jgi:hypothetical protein
MSSSSDLDQGILNGIWPNAYYISGFYFIHIWEYMLHETHLTKYFFYQHIHIHEQFCHMRTSFGSGELLPSLGVISFREEDLWNFSQSENIIGPGSHVEYPTGTKNRNFVEDYPRNISAKFGSNWPSGSFIYNILSSTPNVLKYLITSQIWIKIGVPRYVSYMSWRSLVLTSILPYSLQVMKEVLIWQNCSCMWICW